MTKQDQAMALIVAAVNTWLATNGQLYRVTAGDIVLTHRHGVTFLAFPETRDAVDWRNTRPYSTMQGAAR
jgi:hypothetical protein